MSTGGQVDEPSSSPDVLSWDGRHYQYLILISLQERLRDPAAKLSACEAAVKHLESAYMLHVLPDVWTGAEWWIQVRPLLALTIKN